MSALADLSWPRTTPRLTLRPAQHEDLPAMWAIRSQPEVARWITDASAAWEPFVEKVGALGWLEHTLVVERAGVIIGDLMVRIENGWGQSEVADQVADVQAELGWCFDPAVGGQGYATEAVREVLALAFGDLALRRVTALCFADNEPSWRLMERVGMRREGYHLRESLHRTEGWLDGLTYALLAEEWTDPGAANQRDLGAHREDPPTTVGA